MFVLKGESITVPPASLPHSSIAPQRIQYPKTMVVEIASPATSTSKQKKKTVEFVSTPAAPLVPPVAAKTTTSRASRPPEPVQCMRPSNYYSSTRHKQANTPDRRMAKSHATPPRGHERPPGLKMESPIMVPRGILNKLDEEKMDVDGDEYRDEEDKGEDEEPDIVKAEIVDMEMKPKGGRAKRAAFQSGDFILSPTPCGRCERMGEPCSVVKSGLGSRVNACHKCMKGKLKCDLVEKANSVSKGKGKQREENDAAEGEEDKPRRRNVTRPRKPKDMRAASEPTMRSRSLSRADADFLIRKHF